MVKKQILINLVLFSCLCAVLIAPLFVAGKTDSTLVSKISPKCAGTTFVNVGGINASQMQLSFSVSSNPYQILFYVTVAYVNSTNAGLSGFPLGPLSDENLTTHSIALINSATNQTLNYGVFQYISSNSSWYYDNTGVGSIDLTSVVPNTDLVLVANFTTASGNSYSIETIPFTFVHQTTISMTLSMDNSTGILTILSNAFSTYWGSSTSDVVTDLTASATYSIRDVSSNDQIENGTLTCSSGTWGASINMPYKTGTFYVVIAYSFKSTTMAFSSPTTAVTSNTFTRPFIIGDYLFYLIIGAVVIVVVVFAIILRSVRKQKERIVRKSTSSQKPKSIEIVEISKEELQKKHLTTPIKKTTKKVNQTGLIFDVPTWEVDEESESPTIESTTNVSAPATKAETSAAPAAQTFTLHCSKCNSWYEVDQFLKINCPKCDTPLNAAMWCPSCKKWFNVPEPGDLNCPNCSSKLKTSK